MTGAEWTMLAGVFLGGALPWLEAVVVIPVGILAGLGAVPVVLAAVVGNLLTVGLAAFYGQRLRDWWLARRRVRREAEGATEDPATADRRGRRKAQIGRVMGRWGMPGLAVLGPLGLGTQLSALAAVAVGVSARAAFLWVAGGTVGWSLTAAVLTVTGASFLGIGV